MPIPKSMPQGFLIHNNNNNNNKIFFGVAEVVIITLKMI
jgi:hypothetical protein